MKKKILILCVAMLMMFGICISANAEESGTCGDNVTWVLDDSGTLTITGYGNMTDYDSANSPWLNNMSIRSIKIGKGVTHIGSNTFWGCNNLTDVTIADSVTSIGHAAFECSSLDKVYISDITAYLNINFGDNYSANPMYYADKLYLNNIRVTEVEIPDNITKIPPCAFHGCDTLEKVTIPDSVISIGSGAFEKCGNLKGIIIPNSVTSIGSDAFRESGLISVTIGSGIIDMGEYVFALCSDLESVAIKIGAVVIGEYAFDTCINLTTITIPDSITSIGKYAFYNTGLKSIVIPGGLRTVGDGAFYACGVKNVVIKSGVTCIDTEMFAWCTELTSITIPKSVVEIERDAFDGCSSLTTVIYAGTEEEWNQIYIGGSNEYLTNAKIIFGSTTEPTPTPKPTTYTVTYNANGGSGAPSSQTKNHGTNLTLSSSAPTRTGYDFIGWATSSTATTAKYQPGAMYTTNANLTLYAVWSKKTYTVTYNANGGSGAPLSQIKTYGTNLTLSSSAPTRTGFDFIGWSTSAAATTAQYQPGDTYTSNADLTLYAVWRIAYYGEINELSLQTQSGQAMSEPSQNEGFIVRVKYNETRIRSGEDYLFVAVYGTDGRVLSLDYIQMDFVKDSPVSVGFNVPAQAKQIGSVKAYLWSSFESQKPLAESRTLTF